MQSQLTQLEKTVVSFWRDTSSKLETAGSSTDHGTTKAGDFGDSSKSNPVYACEYGHTATIQGKVYTSASNLECQNLVQKDQQPEVPAMEQESNPDVFHGSLRQRLDCLAKLVTAEQAGNTATLDCFNKVFELLQSILDQFANVATKQGLDAVRVGTRHDVDLFHIALQEDLENNRTKTVQDLKTVSEEWRQNFMRCQDEKTSGETHDQHDRTRQDILSLRREMKQGLKLFREEAKQHFCISREQTTRHLKAFGQEHNQHVSNTVHRLNECLTNQKSSLVAFLESEKLFRQKLLSVPDALKELEEVITTRLPGREDQPQEEMPQAFSFAEIIKTHHKPLEGDVTGSEVCVQMHDQSTQTTELGVMSHQGTQTNELDEAPSNDQGMSFSPDVVLEETSDARLGYGDVISEGTQTLALEEQSLERSVPTPTASVDTNKAYLEMIPLILTGIRDMDQKVSVLIRRVEQQENRASPREVAASTTHLTARVGAGIDLEITSSSRERVNKKPKASGELAEMRSNGRYLESLASLLQPYMSSTSPSLGSSRVPSVSASARRVISEEKSAQSITGRDQSQDTLKETRSSLEREKKNKKQKTKHQVDIKGVFGHKQQFPRASVSNSSSGESAQGQNVQKRKWEAPEVPRSRADLLQQQQQAYRKNKRRSEQSHFKVAGAQRGCMSSVADNRSVPVFQ
ncbi:unnamed protein product [Aureobasidium uvarum]|uniref:Uncharacterized protein n=1 Tax=Aureobasidium uvarum TaxID=2773716 RepID=A0A9N8KFX8_9PEZI|nr:unnamed protein product [Aureobasidium uvarum]